jgi:ligand-binding SRPBCC domain-containing protein
MFVTEMMAEFSDLMNPRSPEMHILSSEQYVPAPLNQVFAFFGKPENLARITPPWLGFEILTPSPIAMRPGALIDYRISLGPFPTHWRTMITAFDPPHLFVDEQLSGPYSFWHHTHRFEVQGSGTLIHDEIRYLLPFGALGRLVHTLMIRRQLEGIFAHRRRVIEEQFPASGQLSMV